MPISWRLILSNCKTNSLFNTPCLNCSKWNEIKSRLFFLLAVTRAIWALLSFLPAGWIVLCFSRFLISRISAKWICSWTPFCFRWINYPYRTRFSHFGSGYDFYWKNYFHPTDWNPPNHHLLWKPTVWWVYLYNHVASSTCYFSGISEAWKIHHRYF